MVKGEGACISLILNSLLGQLPEEVAVMLAQPAWRGGMQAPLDQRIVLNVEREHIKTRQAQLLARIVLPVNLRLPLEELLALTAARGSFKVMKVKQPALSVCLVNSKV